MLFISGSAGHIGKTTLKILHVERFLQLLCRTKFL